MMKNLHLLMILCFIQFNTVKAQCDLDFSFKNTGTNMTVFFTPPAAQAIHADLGDGMIGAFFTDESGNYVCAASQTFLATPIQLAVMSDDSTTPEKDGFASGDPIEWFYKTTDGTLYDLTLNPADTYSINGITNISSASSQAVNCGDLCPPLDTDYTNTGSNMTLFVTPTAADQLSVLGQGQLAVYFNSQDDLVCAGSVNFDGSQAQITAMANDATTTEKDGFNDGDQIIWRFQDASGNQYEINPTPFDTYSLNGISFITAIDFTSISCAVDIEGCTDDEYLEFDPSATIDDNSCETLVVPGCTDVDYLEFNSMANVDDGSCTTKSVSGCTNPNFVEYDANANVDNGSCTTEVVLGCTNTNATNYNISANTNDGSCEYDLIPADCKVSFETTNSGVNHTIMIPPSATNTLSVGDVVGVFYINDSGATICAGASNWTGENMQIVAYGDDTTTPETDGLKNSDPFLFISKSGDNLYTSEGVYQSASMANFAVNGISFITSFNFEYACTEEKLGCMNASACNYDANANTENNSCVFPESYYDCNSDCLNDVDSDGVCDELEVLGCTDANTSNYNESATEDNGTCVSWEQAYEACLLSNGDDGVTQADVDAVQDLLDVANTNLDDALANQEDGVTQADVDAVQALLDVANENLAVALANQGSDDGVTQADVDAVQALLDEANENLAVALANQGSDDGVTQADVDAVQALLDEANENLAVALANQGSDDGVTQADVDAVQALLDVANTNLQSALDNQEDGVTQSDVDAVQTLLDAANTEVIALKAQLENLDSGNSSGGGSCEPIYVELLQGWNIIGYTLPFPQDVTATMASIVADLQIVKNNDARVYWPEYGFNGIGDYIPGQGYQIRMSSGISNYTFPDVGGARVELQPTVPDWVYDLPVPKHPNDIRSLVKVVNLLGQEVDPLKQFKGEVLLYLYNDGTTEKIIK